MSLTAGVDEAGRGPLAGPVVVAAVILPRDHRLSGLADSKRLTARQREALYEPIIETSLAWHIESVGLAEIEQYNILGATLRGMQRCVLALQPQPAIALIDGNRLPAQMPCPARAMVGGDGLEPSISAASVLAKVHRDQLMLQLHHRYPDYGFDKHKGYPTALHLERLKQFGPCAAHRRCFAPVKKLLEAGRVGKQAG